MASNPSGDGILEFFEDALGPGQISQGAESPRSTVYAKLLAAQKAIHGISKTGFNEHFRYKFFEEREVLQVARDALNNAGLAFFYSVEDVSDREVETKNGRVEWITDVRMLCTLYDGESGESVVGKAIGRGQDGQDKGINKAIVAGLKYWLLKTLMIPTDDDTEKNENTVPEGNARSAPRPAPNSTPNGVKHSNVFDLDSKAPGAKAKGKTWRELLEDDDGRGYVQWAIDKMERLTPDGRSALKAALDARKAGPVEAVLLQNALNTAAAVEAITLEQSERIENVITTGDSDEMSAALNWLENQIERKKLAGSGAPAAKWTP